MTPILGNTEFPPGCTSARVQKLALSGKVSFLDMWPSGDIPSPSEIAGWSHPPSIPLAIIQVRHFLQSFQKLGYAPRPLMPFESICRKGEPIRHTLPLLYNLLSDLDEGQRLPFVTQWKPDLGISFTPKQLDKILSLAHKASIANKYQEVGSNSHKMVQSSLFATHNGCKKSR